MFKTKIYVGIAIIVFLGILAMFHIYRNLGSVAGYLATLHRVSVPFSIAALEMEKNAGEYTNGVLRYVSDPDVALRREAEHDIEDFTERYATYQQLSTNDKERALGHKVMADFRQLTAAGNALMDQRDSLDKVFARTTTLLEDTDELLDGPMLAAVAVDRRHRYDVLAALENIEAETAEIGFWMTMFKNRPTALAKQRLLEKVDEQHVAVAQYRALPLAVNEHTLGTKIHQWHLQVERNVHKVIAGETDINQRALELDVLGTRIDDIFDDQIQTMLMSDLSEPQENSDVAVEHVQGTLHYIIPAYFLIAVIVGVLLVLTILRPLKKLTAATKALEAGDLGHRIEAHGSDEFAQLARRFNAMSESLQDSTVSRDLLEASDKRLRQTVVELRDEISERQQAERDRAKMQKRLQRSETMAAMGQLVAGVAHEVRNPLFGISSTLDAMEACVKSGPPNPRYLEVLRREAGRLNKLMADLLDYGRKVADARSIEPLSATLAEAARNCQATAQAAAIEMVLQLDADACVAMNRDRLVQVHVNLIENALQHAPQGTQVIVSTHTHCDESGQHWVGYSVTDAGPGIAAEDLPHIFDPFFTRRRKGTGLGLAIVRRIIDEHHGFIEATNNAQGGASLSVRLPAVNPTSEAV